MSFVTGLALRRPAVTLLVVLLVLGAGIFTFQTLERELFPEMEFPSITVITSYPFANPEAVVREVTEPVEETIHGMTGLKEIRSISTENLSIVLVTFEFGEDLEEAKRTIESNINSIEFPDDVEDPVVSLINSDTLPVLQLSVLGERDIPSLQRILDELIIPEIERVDGVRSADIIGEVAEQVTVTVDTDKLKELGLSLSEVSNAIRNNNTSFPAGNIDSRGVSFPIHAAHEFGSLEDIHNLTIGFEGRPTPGGALLNPQPAIRRYDRPVLLKDVAEATLSTAEATSISRTNGKPSLSIVVVKEPDANTLDVTTRILDALEQMDGIPPDVEIVTLQNDAPDVQQQFSTLLREGLLGFFIAVSVVFIFLINTRPTLFQGMVLTLRPTVIIGLSIPLSILTGILFMGLAGLSLNLMSLSGLVVAIGRVVDDSIVVLENMHRHIQRGEERLPATIVATKEVGSAIVSSTLTTVVVFIPLAFIPGLVGEFFIPFAISINLALVASMLVAMTAVPLLGAILLRQGDFPDEDSKDGRGSDRDTLLQQLYTPVLLWALRNKAITLLVAAAVTLYSLLLIFIIPITFFPPGTPESLTIDVELPTGTTIGRTLAEVAKLEVVLERYKVEGMVEAYQVALGGPANEFGPGVFTGGFHLAGFFVRLADGAPEDIADRIRAEMPGNHETTITVTEISGSPPTDGLKITITGTNFTAISAVARVLEAELRDIDGIINLRNDVSHDRDEVFIRVDPKAAVEFDLTATSVGQQVNQYVSGMAVSEVELEGVTMDIVVKGRPEQVDDIDELNALDIQGPLGLTKLGSISDLAIERGPVSISRLDMERSARITGEIVGEDTQVIGRQVQAKIDALDLPAGVQVKSGGIFQQIEEGFQDVFTAMAIGVILVYLVMVASMGSLRDPFTVVLSLPLAIVGALVALVIADRTLSLSALVGFLLLVGVVVTNSIVLITFVEQLRRTGLSVYDALVEGGKTRVRPILMTAFTTIFALFPLAVSSGDEGGIIGAELATVVIGGLMSSTFLTLIVVPVVYTLMHVSLPRFFDRIRLAVTRIVFTRPAVAGEEMRNGDNRTP